MRWAAYRGPADVSAMPVTSQGVRWALRKWFARSGSLAPPIRAHSPARRFAHSPFRRRAVVSLTVLTSLGNFHVCRSW